MLSMSQQPVKSTILKHGGKSAAQVSVTICKILCYSVYFIANCIIIDAKYSGLSIKYHIRWVYCLKYEHLAWQSCIGTLLFHLYLFIFFRDYAVYHVRCLCLDHVYLGSEEVICEFHSINRYKFYS